LAWDPWNTAQQWSAADLFNPLDPGNPGSIKVFEDVRDRDSDVVGGGTPPKRDTPQPEPVTQRRQISREEALRTLAGGPLSPKGMLQKLDLPGTSRNIATFTEWLRTWSEAYVHMEPAQHKLTQKGADYLRDNPKPQ
jgi:hypothetical protein